MAKTATKKTSGRSGLLARVGRGFVRHLSEHSDDAVGLGLILVAVVAGLGIYADAAGPVGEFLDAVMRGLLGVYGFVVPVLLAYFGLLIAGGRPGPDVGRVAVGIALTFASAIAGWHLIAGAPSPSEGIRTLWDAGGLLGWAVSGPLVWALSVWGAAAVLLIVLLLGLLIVTKTPFAKVIEAARAVGAQATDAAGTITKRETDADPAPVDDDAGSRATIKIEPDEDEPEDDAVMAPPPDGMSAADVAAGRTPAPPLPEYTADGKRRARKVAPVENWDDYQLPPLDMLTTGKSMKRESRRHIEAQVEALQETFEQFGIEAIVARWSRGPTVTRFEIELGPGVKVKKVANMGDDIAYALAAPDVRIVAPIPGKSAIGIEVPNRNRDLITLGDILQSDDAKNNGHPLYVALGVDVAGNPALVNLTTMPHLLVSGATGSGKSVTLNSMITSVIMRSRPDQVRMILIDPKRVELTSYDGAPHLLSPVVTDPRRATDAVQWCVKEMEKRYEILARLGYRNVDSYNRAVAHGEVEAELSKRHGVDPEAVGEEAKTYGHLPYILLVIDELSDLMLVAPRDVEDAICRIAQMARAVGIHMVIATQRPSVDVITGLIKANIPSRLSLAVASQTDSRTILDMAGAEKLVGNGDMLFLPSSQGKPSRLQGCFVSEREIEPVVQFCKTQRDADYVDGVVKTGDEAEEIDLARGGDDDSDEVLLKKAAAQVVESGLGSTSMLQRKLRIGFARAGRLMDELEQIGVVGPNEGSKAREVLWSPEELEEGLRVGVFDGVFA